MKNLEEMNLDERIKLYAEGNTETGIPQHSFDFSTEDEENIMQALRISWMLSRIDFVHNFQNERKDISDYCRTTTSIIRIAKKFIDRCPLSGVFRLNFNQQEECEN